MCATYYYRLPASDEKMLHASAVQGLNYACQHVCRALHTAMPYGAPAPISVVRSPAMTAQSCMVFAMPMPCPATLACPRPHAPCELGYMQCAPRRCYPPSPMQKRQHHCSSMATAMKKKQASNKQKLKHTADALPSPPIAPQTKRPIIFSDRLPYPRSLK